MKRISKTGVVLVFSITLLVIIGLISILTTEKKQTTNLNVAVIIPLTGAVGQTGEDFLNGLLLAKEKINPQINLYVEDSRSNAMGGVSAAKKLLNTQDIDVIVSLQSAVVVPILTLAEQYNKPLIATAISKEEFTNQSKYAFRLFPPASQDAALAAEFAYMEGFRNVSLLTINDEYGTSMREYFKKNFKGDITYEESFKADEQDFRTILLKISDSDAVFFIGYIPNYINLFKQINELGENITVISNLVMISNFVRGESGTLLTNSFATAPLAIVGSNSNKFAEEYKNKYGKGPDWSAYFGYDMLLILDALQKSKKEPIDALHEIKINGLNGVISFDEHGEAYIPLAVVQAENGSIRIINMTR